MAAKVRAVAARYGRHEATPVPGERTGLGALGLVHIRKDLPTERAASRTRAMARRC
jgi:hypothetical protein